ncbi:hypothetical protein Tco_0044962 [Tanacetum coccineum]
MASEVPPPENVTTTGVALETDLGEEVATMGPRISKKCRKKGNDGADTNAPPKVLRKDHAASHLTQSTAEEKSLALVGLETGPTFPSIPKRYVAQSSKGAAVAGDPESENTSFTSMAGSPGNIYQPGWGVTNGCRLDTPEACQDLVDHLAPPRYFSELRHLPNDDFLGQYNINLAWQVAMGSQLRLRFEQETKLLKKSIAQVARRDQRIQARENEIKNLEALLEAETDMKKAAEANNVELSKELESLRAKFSDLQVNNNQLSQQVASLQAQVTGEERIKAAFEEFKKYEDDRVSSRCAEMDARPDALSIDFDEELYPHMLTAIAGRRWVIGHVEQGGVELDLANIKAYDPEAEDKFMATMQVLKDRKYPLIDELEKLKDAPMDIVMASLYLESDTGEDAPQWIRDFRPSSSQLNIPLYPEVRDPKYPWVVKEEMLLEDAIAANKSRAEKKRKCWIICRTHEDAAAQTEPPEDRLSPRLVRSKSLPAMYTLDWP